MSEETRFRPEELLRLLVERDVRFVIIGGFAAQAHGSPSLTGDLDIVPSWDGENLRKIAEILVGIAAVRHGLPIDTPPMPPLDAQTLRAGSVFTLNSRFGRIDLLANPDPGFDHEILVRNAIQVEFFGLPVLAAGLDDLMAMKRAAGRPKDRVELEILGALREEIDRRPE
jgi:predicted nucleotidyltransferase